MVQKTGLTTPYRDKQDVKLAIDYLRNNCDPVYVLIFKMAVTTGLRISDVLNLRWENIRGDKLRINEAKGTKAALARAKAKVLKRAKATLLALTDDKEKMIALMSAKPADVYDHIPENLRPMFDNEIAQAQAKAKPKSRECVLPSPLVRQLHNWKRKHKGIDGGYLFPANLVRYAKVKTPKPISRKSVWTVFSKISKECGFDFNTSCHQLRKTFAVFLYESSDKDSALVVKTVGWENDNYLKRYLAVEQDKCNEATKQMQDDFLR